MHCVFTTITPKEEYFESAKTAILSILEDTRNETGCIQFDVHTNTDETELFLYEQWVNESALQLHYLQDYTQKVFVAYETWLAKPVDITAMEHLG